MSVNFGKEYKKFRAEQKKLREYYESLGMSKEVIDTLYEFDKMQFCENLSFRRRTRYLDVVDEDEITEEDKSPLLKKYLRNLSVPFEFYTSDKFWWIQEIEDKELLKNVLRLPDDDLELITYLVFEDFKQKHIAEIRGVSQQSISKQIGEIKQKLKTF